MAWYFKSQITKMTKDFSKLKNVRSRPEVRPVHPKISISRGKHIRILLWNLTTMKELTALLDKWKQVWDLVTMPQGVRSTYIYDVVVKFKSKPWPRLVFL